MSLEYIDTHAHLDYPEFEHDWPAVLDRAQAAGLVRIVAVGTDADSSERCVAMSGRFDLLRAAVGIHPTHLLSVQPADWDRIVTLTEQDEVVAIGETGLDLYWKETPLPLQQEYFDRHLRLSQETNLPVIIHQRDSAEEILVMLREARKRGPLTGIMHSFAASAAVATECLELGLHVSFAGMVTFKNAADLRAIAESIPADRILIETDSPYLSPHPLRGKHPNEPARVVHTAQCLADVRKVSLDVLAAQTTANARALFRF